MLDAVNRQLVKSTAPLLKEGGVALTSHFYQRMFSHNPELREFFNQGHQHVGAQQQALAMAVAAYAEHIDNPSVLMPVLARIAAKHVSLNVRKEHYAIVGKHLLASIQEVLGDAASPELVAAWAAAYQQLAGILVDLEQTIYDEAAAKNGGWTGWRTFRVQNKVVESSEITSFELAPADQGTVPTFKAGQYIAVRVVVPALGYRQPRQYSLSDAPNKTNLRISVKREAATDHSPAGMVSNHLHEHINVGDVLEVAPPAGDFFLDEERNTPVVLLSAGVGITPMMSILEHLTAQRSTRCVRFIHAARHAEAQAFANRVQACIATLADGQLWIAHEHGDTSAANGQCNVVGRIDLVALQQQGLLPADADYYVCGPQGFMVEQIQTLRRLGVAESSIHAEAFGTGGVPA